MKSGGTQSPPTSLLIKTLIELPLKAPVDYELGSESKGPSGTSHSWRLTPLRSSSIVRVGRRRGKCRFVGNLGKRRETERELTVVSCHQERSRQRVGRPEDPLRPPPRPTLSARECVSCRQLPADDCQHLNFLRIPLVLWRFCWLSIGLENCLNHCSSH